MPKATQFLTCIAIAWFLIGLSGLFWWLFLGVIPEIRPYFDAYPEERALFRLALPDVALFCGVAFLTSTLYMIRNRKARWSAMAHLGATLYATLYCLQASLSTGRAWLATIAMVFAVLFILGVIAIEYIVTELKEASFS